MKIAVWVAGALTLLAGGASAAGTPQIAFSTGDGLDQADIVLVNPDGTGLVNLTPGQQNVFDDDRSPSWSRDGTKLAFVSHRDANNTEEIYVMNADGTSPRRLTTDSGNDQIFNIDPAWSPDGSRIAWRKVVGTTADDIWVMNADGTGKRRLTSEGGRKTPPQWSPDSTRLLTSRDSSTAGSGVVLIDVAAGTSRNVTPTGVANSSPRWSPDGSRIAFVRAESVWVMNADGTGARQLSAQRGFAPVWSPDGQAIAFSAIRTFPELANRFGPPARSDVFTVDVSGADERRLTGPGSETFQAGAEGSAPSFWPDGSRLFFASFRPGDRTTTTYVMNVDGTCETRFGPPEARLLSPPAWRPGASPNLGQLSCIDLRLSAVASTDAVGVNGLARYDLTIENDGTLTATGVTLRAQTRAPAALERLLVTQSCGAGAAITCSLDPIPARSKVQLSLLGRFSTPGAFTASFAIDGAERESDASDNEAQAGVQVYPCTIVGTPGNDAISGTPKGDRICARTGWDRILGQQGNDWIDAGNGNDTVEGGKGRDTIVGRGGRDVILVRDGEVDTVDCGSEADVVLADARDKVARNCEEVFRP